MRLSVRYAVLIAVLAACLPAAAQDAHYWTYGYGPVGQLTEGVLVGGVSDLSAVFYNPGALALLEKPRFVVGLTSVELANIEVPGVGGDRLDTDQLVFDIVPSMVAGQVGSETGDNRFALAFLSRNDTDWDLGFTDVRVSPGSPNAGAGFGRLRQRMLEYWVGGTWSHRFSDRFSAGVSPFLAYRAQRSRRSLSLESVSGTASSAAFIGKESEYSHIRALAKGGVAWRPGPWELGMTVTAPGFRLAGSGKTVWNASATGDVPRPFLSASTQKGLHADYQAPWSVAGGATWRGRTWAIHSTVEWFSEVETYDILEPEPALVSGSAETIPLTFEGASMSIACYGGGLEVRLGPRVVLYGGAAHNESAFVAERDTFAAWDLTDVTSGFTFETGRATLALGLGYAWGANTIVPAIAPVGSDAAPTSREARLTRWTFSVGASFHH
jgi:hypothetical protein